MRHPIATLPIHAEDAQAHEFLREGEAAERAGDWYRSAEAFRALGILLRGGGARSDAARAFARAASHFELSGQWRDAARAYSDSATALFEDGNAMQAAGELFNRAAWCFLSSREGFNAGDAYRRCADAFSKVSQDMIDTQHNIEPIPGGAHRLFVAARAYSAAGDAFLPSEPTWAAMSYWQAGEMCRQNGVGYHAFVAYRKAFLASLKHRATLDRGELRRVLPLSAQERAAGLDPIQVMEDALLKGWTSHRNDNPDVYDAQWPRRKTDEEMVHLFREFSAELNCGGNGAESGQFYILSRKRERRLAWAQRRFMKALGLTAWKLACGFGESLSRWAATCAVIILAFAGLFAWLPTTRPPIGSWRGALYFSFLTFSNFGHDDVHPAGLLGKGLASAEIVLGLVMLGMLLTYVTRRVFR